MSVDNVLCWKEQGKPPSGCQEENDMVPLAVCELICVKNRGGDWGHPNR